MGILIRCIQAESMKSKRTPLVFIHLLFPVVGALVFAGYFRTTGRLGMQYASAFLEAAAIAFPFLAGIMVSIVIQLESEAGHFQLMLGTIRSRAAVYTGKLVYLFLLAAVSTALCLILFAVLYPVVPISFYRKPLGVLLLSNLPVYLISLLCGFRFGKSVPMGLGIAGSLVSALMMTGLGDSVWKFIPWAWGIRLVEFQVLEYISPEQFSYWLPECETGFFLMLGITVILFVFSLIWFNRWEGRKGNE